VDAAILRKPLWIGVSWHVTELTASERMLKWL